MAAGEMRDGLQGVTGSQPGVSTMSQAVRNSIEIQDNSLMTAAAYSESLRVYK